MPRIACQKSYAGVRLNMFGRSKEYRSTTRWSPSESTGQRMGCGKECGVSLVRRPVSLVVGLFAVPQITTGHPRGPGERVDAAGLAVRENFTPPHSPWKLVLFHINRFS